MKSFLSHITDSIPGDTVHELDQWCFVFPSKRAGLYFMELLQNRFQGSTFWSPDVLSVEEFVYKFAGHTPGDDISMVFRLFEVYRSLEPTLTFEKFYSWGQVLLSDFDEIDRYLVDSKKLYKGLKSLEDIDQAFGDNEEMKKAYQRFVQLFVSDINTELATRFVKNWERIHKAYDLFAEKMEREQLFYSGKIYRMLAEGLQENRITISYKKVVLAGFNALSASEEVIFKTLLEQGIGEVYWDCDQLYMHDDREEAGDFLRVYKKKWNFDNIHWITTNMLDQPKTISITGCPQLVAQARYAGHILENKQLPKNRDTAFILADENMLMPVLHAIRAPAINITMGYPVRNTSLYQFVLEVLNLHAETRMYKTGKMYASSRVLRLLESTLVSPVFIDISESITDFIREERLKWVAADEIVQKCDGHWLKHIFLANESVDSLLNNVNAFLVELFYHIKNSGEEKDDTSPEIIFHGVRQLKRFAENIQKQSFTPDFKFLAQLFGESFRGLKIPFSGEPLDGLQVMGFLETRALDFKHVVLLGVNENKLPRSGFGNSYIPFVARKAFGLPTFEEHEAIYAYHFKRVLQRAETIHILYDTEVAIDGSGEKSRFILQLMNKVGDGNHNLSVIENNVSIPYRHMETDAAELIVHKSPSVMEKLNRYVLSDGEGKIISPTRLITYIDCNMRFYLQYVARIPETELLSDKIDKRIFGNILHKAVEFLYQPYTQKTLTTNDLKAIASQENISKKVKEALLDQQVIHPNHDLSGSDILLESVLKKLLKKIIDQDLRRLPFVIGSLEEKLKGGIRLPDGREVTLGGLVDRIDLQDAENGKVHTIIDYKSGKVEFVGSSRQTIDDPEAYIQPYFEDGRYKAGFQAYYYVLLYRKNNPDAQVKAAIYQLAKLSDGMKLLRKNSIISDDILEAYRKNLVALIEDILNPDIPFTQTKDTQKCVYCPYTAICGR